MTDIGIHQPNANPLDYIRLVEKIKFYLPAIEKTLDLAAKYVPPEGTIADFCCATGTNSYALAERVSVASAFLIDIHKGRINEAEKAGIKVPDLRCICGDILETSLPGDTVDLVLSTFAYHHMTNKDKPRYINQINSCLKPNAFVILTEIFVRDKDSTWDFYQKAYDELDEQDKTSEMKNLLEQIAESSECEFKVSKEYAENQFLSQGFTKIQDCKIWPLDLSLADNEGTFVQAWRKK